jgi:ribonuclease HII
LVGIPKKNQLPLVKGDSISISIAAASIVAKVYRDSLMEKLGRNEHFLPYLWSKNKGYGTSEHRKALSQYGITKYHRIQFVETSKKNSLKDSIVDTTI